VRDSRYWKGLGFFVLVNTRVQQRVRSVTVALAASVVLLGAAASSTPAANPGGASAGPGAAPAPVSRSAPAATPGGATLTITDARCVPANACSGNPRQVSTRGRLLLHGHGLRSGLTVAFPRAPGARISRRGPSAHMHRSALGLVVSVPSVAHSGRIEILSGSHHSNAFGPIVIVRHALHPPRTVKRPTSLGGVQSGAAPNSPFDGQGMWIWYVSQSDGGDLPSIVAQAHAAGVTTLFVKSSDGSTNYWSQFTPQLVQQLHANGLKVCAWQYVYGTHPLPEADLGARAVAYGADCLVIDAEAEYEGHYGAAQSYITELRSKIGPSYPLGLASFPYVDYHPALPYSVFLGPGGAQYNAPQMYWKEIGTSVDTVYSHTFVENRIYGRPIFPLGQSYNNPSSTDLVRFRQLAGAYGSTGLSWWDWQETSTSGWASLAAPLTPPSGFAPATAMATLAQGSKGDPVLWMQEHLATAVPPQPTTGVFDATTAANLQTFQANRGIPPTGVTDAATWQALLALAPVPVDWTSGGPKAGTASIRTHGVRVASAPLSAHLPSVRNEIGEPGASRAHSARPRKRG
jgi:hypothetical protein